MCSRTREDIAFKLGKHEATNISADINSVSSSYRDLDQLLALKTEVYLRKGNKVVMSFLNGIASAKTDQNTLHTCLALEHVYQLACSNTILPFSFILNLMQYQSTQSKFCINLNSKVHPCGAYKTVNNWLTNQGSDPLPFPDRDCIVAFDNDQVIGKSWYIKTDNKVNSSIVTSFCAVEFETSLQYDSKFHPKIWFKYSDFQEKLANVRNRDGSMYSLVYDCHFSELHVNLDDVVQNVYEEQKSAYQNGVFKDCVDKSVSAQANKDNLLCIKCGVLYKKIKSEV